MNLAEHLKVFKMVFITVAVAQHPWNFAILFNLYCSYRALDHFLSHLLWEVPKAILCCSFRAKKLQIY